MSKYIGDEKLLETIEDLKTKITSDTFPDAIKQQLYNCICMEWDTTNNRCCKNEHCSYNQNCGSANYHCEMEGIEGVEGVDEEMKRYLFRGWWLSQHIETIGDPEEQPLICPLCYASPDMDVNSSGK